MEYQKGNERFLQMISGEAFSEELANDLLKGVDLNTPICDLNGYTTTYLYEAVSENNLPAASFLLKHGADPNLYIPELVCDCPLWELQYLDNDQDWKTRYEISKLFFQYGANPNIKCDGESLYDSVVFEVYNEPPSDESAWKNLLHFYKLLVVFGGGADDGEYGKPRLTDVNPGKVDEYSIGFIRHEDGYHIIRKLVNGEGKVIGDL